MLDTKFRHHFASHLQYRQDHTTSQWYHASFSILKPMFEQFFTKEDILPYTLPNTVYTNEYIESIIDSFPHTPKDLVSNTRSTHTDEYTESIIDSFSTYANDLSTDQNELSTDQNIIDDNSIENIQVHRKNP